MADEQKYFIEVTHNDLMIMQLGQMFVMAFGKPLDPMRQIMSISQSIALCRRVDILTLIEHGKKLIDCHNQMVASGTCTEHEFIDHSELGV